MIFRDSRYATGEVTRAYRPARDDYPVVVYRNFPNESSKYFLYEWSEQDRIDQVAKKLLGYSHLWWKIMDYNPEHLSPLDIPPGSVIRIPNA